MRSVAARSNLIDLIRVFDVDYLAGRSYGLFPVRSGDPGKLASDVQKALQIDADGPLSGALSVIPIEQANAIMVSSTVQRMDCTRNQTSLMENSRITGGRSNG